MGSKQQSLKLIEELKEASLSAFKQEHYLQSAIIIFQTVEYLLRMAVVGYAQAAKVPEKTIKIIRDDEQRFPRLVMYLDMAKPNNGLSERLNEFNKKRNSIIHRLFSDFESLELVKEQAQEFCLQGIKLNEALRELMGLTVEPSRGSSIGETSEKH